MKKVILISLFSLFCTYVSSQEFYDRPIREGESVGQYLKERLEKSKARRQEEIDRQNQIEKNRTQQDIWFGALVFLVVSAGICLIGKGLRK